MIKNKFKNLDKKVKILNLDKFKLFFVYGKKERGGVLLIEIEIVGF